MKTLYFIRHGESEFNKAKKWSGSSDAPLTELGKSQAKQAGRKLKKQGLSIDMIVASPLTRAHDTAKHIANELDYDISSILLHDKLIERDFGILEGRKDLVATTRYVVDESSIDSYEGVESLQNLQERATEILEYIYTLPQETVVIVAHGAIGRAIRRQVNNAPLGLRGQSFKNAEIVRFI